MEVVGNIVKKISTYDFLNSLVPGSIFAVMLKIITGTDVFCENILINLIAIYVLGIIISRVGSLFLEPFLYKIVKASKYRDYVNAEKRDPKLSLLVCYCNYYRSMATVFLLVFIISCAKSLWGALNNVWPEIFGTTFLNVLFAFVIPLMISLLFVLSFRKQVKYINERVEFANKKKR